MDCLMKKISMLMMAALAVTTLSCNKENAIQEEENQPVHRQTLVAQFADEETKTFFDGTVFKWNADDKILVRSDNAAGYTVFDNSTGESAGAVTFEAETDDTICYGDESFALYPNSTSDGCPKIEETILKIYPKPTYTWSEGAVQAPMIAKVVSGENLEFTHLGGLLKVTYKNVPPKARYIKVTAPIDATHYYKISQTMGPGGFFGWEDGVGFTLDKPYIKAYNNGKTNEYFVRLDINAATPAQRASDDGITAYIPLPVGPNEGGVYPTLKVSLTFADGTTVPGSDRTATNIPIQRAHIKPMPAIVMPKYTVETIITGLARTPHNLTRLSDDQFVVTAEQYHVYFLDVVNNTATQSAVNASSKYPPYPYGVCCIGNNLWIANKTGATGNCIYKYDMTTQLYSIATTGINQAMQIQEHDGNVYVLGRGDGSNAGKIHVFTGNVPGAVDAEVFADFSGIASSGYAWPLSFAFDTDGSMVVAVSASAGTPSECFKLYRVASKGATPVAIFGSGTKASNYAGLVDGSSSSATFSANMLQMQFDGEGNLYIGDTFAVRKLVRGATGLEDGTIMTLTESGSVTNTDGLAMDSTCSHIYLSNKSTKSISKVTIE